MLFFPSSVAGKNVLKFITRFFAVIGFLVVGLVALSVGLALRMQNHVEPEPDSVILTLDFSQPVVEQSTASPFELAMADQP